MRDEPGDSIAVLVEFKDAAYRDAVTKLLAQDSRPDFAELPPRSKERAKANTPMSASALAPCMVWQGQKVNYPANRHIRLAENSFLWGYWHKRAGPALAPGPRKNLR